MSTTGLSSEGVPVEGQIKLAENVSLTGGMRWTRGTIEQLLQETSPSSWISTRAECACWLITASPKTVRIDR